MAPRHNGLTLTAAVGASTDIQLAGTKYRIEELSTSMMIKQASRLGSWGWPRHGDGRCVNVVLGRYLCRLDSRVNGEGNGLVTRKKD
jgi:hypothetical protein